EEDAAREHDVAALLVELDDLELVGLANQLVEIADGPQSTWDPGRNAFTPPRMVTERPPFTRWLIVPSMISSRSHALEISSQTFILSAFSLDREIRPSSLSRLSMKTSTLSPGAMLSSPLASMNSSLLRTPSDLPPMSTMTKSRLTRMTTPVTICPSPPSSCSCVVVWACSK